MIVEIYEPNKLFARHHETYSSVVKVKVSDNGWSIETQSGSHIMATTLNTFEVEITDK